MSTILIISPEPWDGHFVSKHHYARELARRGHTVLIHGPPTAEKGLRLALAMDTPGDLRVLYTPRVAPGLRLVSTSLRRALETRWLGKVEQALGQSIDVVWNFENSRFFDMRFASDRLKIYQQVDLNQDFQPEIAASTADLSIAISGPIEQRLQGSARRLIRLTHGVAENSLAAELIDGIETTFNASAVNAVLVGNIDIAYLDLVLMVQLVETHPDVRFHFVGKYSESAGLHGAVGAAPNTVFWGRQPAHLLPSFLQRADVLLIAYLAGEHLEQLANPHKMMEYLASGCCVLATRTLDYENCSDLVEMASDREDYAQRFASIVENPSVFNSAELSAKRQAFAQDNTYSRQLDRIAQALGSRGVLIT